MREKNEFEDDEDTYRPLEPHEQQQLSEKRLEKLDSRVNRMEALLEKIALTLKRLIGKGDECKDKKTQKEREECDTAEKVSQDRMDYLDKKERSISDETDELSKEEVTLRHEVKRRRKQDSWYGLVMMDCRFKMIEKDNKIICTKTGKRCNYKNCPIKGDVRELTA
jgi:hypothetical protein